MRYVVQRLTRFLIVFFIVTFGVMVLLRLGLDQPGDPARTMLGGFATAGGDRRHHGEVPPRRELPRPVLALAAADRRRAGLRLLGVEQHRRQLADRPPHRDDRAARRLRRDPRPASSPCRWRCTRPTGATVRSTGSPASASFVFVSRAGDRRRRRPQAAVRRALAPVPAHRRAGLPVGRPRRARPQLHPAGRRRSRSRRLPC